MCKALVRTQLHHYGHFSFLRFKIAKFCLRLRQRINGGLEALRAYRRQLIEGARQRLRGLSSLSRKVARMKAKEGKKLLKCKGKDGQEHKPIQYLTSKRKTSPSTV